MKASSFNTFLVAAILYGTAQADPAVPTRQATVAPGVEYLYYGNAATRMHAVVLARSHKEYELRVLADETDGYFIGHNAYHFATTHAPQAVAAINGGFWGCLGGPFPEYSHAWLQCRGFEIGGRYVPTGTLVTNGDEFGPPHNGEVIFGASRASYQGFHMSIAPSADWPSPAYQPFHYYALGMSQLDLPQGLTPQHVMRAGVCEPPLGRQNTRSAIGYGPASIVLLSSDHGGDGDKADIPDLCWYFRLHGVTDAMLLDGGSSSQMYVRGQGEIVNPVFAPISRLVANAIGIVKVCQVENESCSSSSCCFGFSCQAGVCRDVTPQPQCVDNTNCPSTEHCASNVCVADLCQQGQPFCDGSDRRQCSSSGSNSTFIETCFFGCSGGMCEQQCTGDSGCSSTQYCSGGMCLADQCDQGQLFCDGVDRRQCVLNGSGSTFIQTCMYGCLNGQCQPQCTGDASCAAAQYCLSGSCVADICPQGNYFCSGSDRRLCSLNGAASSFEETCTAGCLNGACTSPAPVALAMNLTEPWQLTLDSTHVYWVEKLGGSVRRVPKVGGVVQTLGTALEPTAIVVGGSYAYVLERNGGSNGSVRRFPVAGGASELVVGGLQNAQNVMVQDATYLYFGDYQPSLDGVVRRVRKQASSTLETFVQGNGLVNLPTGVAIDASYLYVINDAGNLLRAPLGGGPVVNLGAGGGGNMKVSGSTIYFSGGGGNPGEGLVGSMPNAGGPLTTLISGRSGPSTVFIDSAFVYWIEMTWPGGVFRVDTSGGGFKTYSTSADNSMGLAVDANYVYWTDPAGINDGRVMRAPK